MQQNQEIYENIFINQFHHEFELTVHILFVITKFEYDSNLFGFFLIAMFDIFHFAFLSFVDSNRLFEDRRCLSDWRYQ